MQFYRVQRLQNKPNTCILKLLFVVLVIYRDVEQLEPLNPLLSSRSSAGFFLPWIGPESRQITGHKGAPMSRRYKCLVPFSFIFPARVSLIFAELFLAQFSLFSGTFVWLEFRLCQAINFRTEKLLFFGTDFSLTDVFLFTIISNCQKGLCCYCLY